MHVAAPARLLETPGLRAVLVALLTVAMATVFVAPVHAEGRTFWVAPDGRGTDVASGAEDDPWGDIEKAMYELAPGDTLNLRGGEYRQRPGNVKPLARATADNRITIQSAPGERAVIVGGLDIGQFDGMHHWTIRDLEFRWDESVDDPGRALVRIGGGIGWVLDGVEVHGARSYANVRVYNREPGSARDWAIRNSCIHDTIPTRTDRQNTEHNVYVGGGSHPDDLPTNGGVIEGNFIFNARNGSNIKLGAGEPTLPGTHDVVVRDNVLANAPQNVLVPWKSHDNTIERNLMVQEDNGSWSQPWYPNVRGLELEGTGNVARDNGGNGSGGVVGNNKSRVAVADVDNVLLERDDTGVAEVSCDGLANRTSPGNAWGPDAVGVDTRRIAGDSRTDTAARLSKQAFPQGADTVLLARSDSYADALAGAPLAGELGAPLLLTPTAGLVDETRAEIERLGATEAVLLGGSSALSGAVTRELRDLGLDVRRLAGETRFDTAAVVAAELTEATSVFLVEGANPDPARGWPDAVALSSLAARTATPVLLTTRDVLPDETSDALAALAPEALTVVGGTTAVSEDVLRAAGRAAGVDAERLAGGDRYATSAAIALEATKDGADPSAVWLVTGLNWPDALAAGPASAAAGATLLFVHGGDARNSQPTLNWLRYRTDPDELLVTLVGGPGAISANAEATLRHGAPTG